MKRFLVLIIAILYFAVSSGFTVHVHYCMGHIVDTSLMSEDGDEHNCTHCGMKKKKGGNGCCKDEHKIVKHAPDHSLVKEIKLLVPVFFTLPSVQKIQAPVVAFQAEADVSAFQANAPPEPPSCPVYLKIRNIRI